MFEFHDHWVGIYPSSSFTDGRRTAMTWRCRASMTVSLIVDVTLLIIMPVIGLFPSNIFYFSRGCHWVQFLLFVITEIERFDYGGYPLLW